LGTIPLTYQTPDVDSGRDRPATKPTDEIEVTPKMIEAGGEVMDDALDGVVQRGSECGRFWARLVFEAMARRMLRE
jgi:hypothetical protein